MPFPTRSLLWTGVKAWTGRAAHTRAPHPSSFPDGFSSLLKRVTKLLRVSYPKGTGSLRLVLILVTRAKQGWKAMPSNSATDHLSWSKATQRRAQPKLLVLPRTVRFFLTRAGYKLSRSLFPNFQRLISCYRGTSGCYTCPTDQQLWLLPVSPPFPNVSFACLRPPRVGSTNYRSLSGFLPEQACKWVAIYCRHSWKEGSKISLSDEAARWANPFMTTGQHTSHQHNKQVKLVAFQTPVSS